MRTRNTRWAATIAIILTMGMAVLVVTKSVPKAYALERVIAAYNSVRYLHVKTFTSGKEQPSEFWIQSDSNGKVAKARYYLPLTEDGVKIITWTPEKAEIWFQSKRRFQTFQTTRIEGWMQSMLDQSQPQPVLERLLQGRKTGKIDIHMQRPEGAQKEVVMVATYKAGSKRDRYWIDPRTELIIRIENFLLKDGQEVLQSRMEFCEYNVPIDEKMFSLRTELPKDVRVADQLSEPIGVAQANMTDPQAAAETVRQFFQALVDKNFKKAGLIVCGEVEEHAREEYGVINIASTVSVGPAVHQPRWQKRGYKVPCELQIINAAGERGTWRPEVYVRPGDDERYPDRWNITGGIDARLAHALILADNDKYAKMTPKEAASAFLKACSEENWEEFAKFLPAASDPMLKRAQQALGGLEVISIGEAFKETNGYAGWYVPYEIRFRPQFVNVRVSNSNSARRGVVTGIYDLKLHLLQDFDWSEQPAVLPNNDIYAKMSPVEVAQAYFKAQARLDWEEMQKFTSTNDVATTRRQVSEAQKKGVDWAAQAPVWEPMEAVWSAEQSCWFVKCRVSAVKKWNLAIRNDNPAGRFLWDGGI